MPKRSVLVLYNQPRLPLDDPHAESEHSVVDNARHIARTLAEAGYRTSTLALGSDPTPLWQELKRRRVDVVFNLFEGNHDHTETESYVAGLLDWAGVPYTGSPFTALTLARAKHTAKYLLRGAGLPTADFQVAHGPPAPKCTVRYPVIVKPATQDASVGIDHDSVCTSQRQVNRCVAKMLREFGPPVLIEKYIPGREFHVAVVALPELRALAPIEINLPRERAGVWALYTHRGKWHKGTAEYDMTTTRLADDLSAHAARVLSGLAVQAFQLLECRDYARVDFRMTPTGRAYILEVNPNPDVSRESDLMISLGPAGWSHADFLTRVVEATWRRRPGR